MQNVVNLQPDRARPPRDFAVPRSGARILFFTGVRYCRDEEGPAPDREEARFAAAPTPVPERAFDATAH